MTATLAAIFICRDVERDADGVISATNIIDAIDFETFPVRVDLAVVVKLIDATGPLTVRVHYIREGTGQVVYDLEASPPGVTGQRLQTFLAPDLYFFNQPDAFRVRVIVNGNDIGGTYFRVGMRSRMN